MMNIKRQWQKEDATLAHNRAMEREGVSHQNSLDRLGVQNDYATNRQQAGWDREDADTAAAGGLLERIHGERDGVGASSALIAEFEAFRETPYFDVNADRIGFGSDTITLADGTVKTVGKGDRVSRDDAQRDLTRRVKEFQGGIASNVGQERWSQFSPAQQAALTSIAYNYGSLGSNGAGIMGVVRNGSPAEIEKSIRSLARHNDGINSSRRNKEADIFASGGNIGFGVGDMTAGDWGAFSKGDPTTQKLIANGLGLGVEAKTAPTNQRFADVDGDGKEELVGMDSYGQIVPIMGLDGKPVRPVEKETAPKSLGATDMIKLRLTLGDGDQENADAKQTVIWADYITDLMDREKISFDKALAMAIENNVREEEDGEKIPGTGLLGSSLMADRERVPGAFTTEFRSSGEAQPARATAPAAPSTESKSFDTPEDVKAAIKAGTIKNGDIITLNGKRVTVTMQKKNG